MAIKLKLPLKSPQSALLLKAAIFVISFWLFKTWEPHLLPLLIFLAVSVYLYFRSPAQSLNYLISFLVLLFLAFRYSLDPRDYPGFLLVLAMGFLFYLLLGLKNLLFIYRSRWHHLLILFLNYLTFIVFFLSDRSNYFFLKAGGIFLILFLLWWEFFRKTTLAGITATLALETLWGVNLLPLELLGMVNLSLLITFVFTDLIRREEQDKLSPRAILADVSLLVVLTILIFMTSRWSI